MLDLTQTEEICMLDSSACPCNNDWEHTCTAPGMGENIFFCQPKTAGRCPLFCEFGECTNASTGEEFCAPPTGCPCSDSQLSCKEWNYTICYDQASTCPLVCENLAMPMTCDTIGFEGGQLVATAQDCMAVTADNLCPVTCDQATAKRCGAGANAWCIPKAESCPVTCSATEQTCYVNNYNAAGEFDNTTEKCAPLGMPCSCGTNQQQCKDEAGNVWCDASCPVYCNPGTHKMCYAVSFTTEGEEDFGTEVKTTCVRISQPCTCGANSKLCKWTDGDISYEECFWDKDFCPVTCKAEQQLCYIQDYNASGYPISSREQCSRSGTSCPCGTGSTPCMDEFGHSYCMPLRDFWSGETLSCPIHCKADEEEYDIVNYWPNGSFRNWKESCIKKGAKPMCGTNARECVVHEFGTNYSECIPRVGGFCPKQCGAGEVSCPEIADYMRNGSITGYRSPSVQCAASYDQCGCGRQAEMCRYGDGWGECESRQEGCPVSCKTNEKKCFLNDYAADGTFISDREVCVAVNASCPCGRNSGMCPGQTDDDCYPNSQFSEFCRCKASEEECYIENFGKDGIVTGTVSQCVPKGQKCPCGSNARACPDPNDATQDDCVPMFTKDGRGAGCPSKCTPEQQMMKNGKPEYENCVQTNLDSAGSFVSKTTTCVPYGTCQPGAGFKKCPDGAIIELSKKCKRLYGTSNATAVDASTKQTSEMTLSVNDANVRGAGTAGAMICSELQCPSTISVAVSMQGSTATSRRLSTAAKTVKVTFQNEGASTVSPQAVVTQALSKVKSGELSSAMSSLGEVELSQPVIVSNTMKTVETRAAAAQKVKEAMAEAATPTTTPSTKTPPTPSPLPPTPSPEAATLRLTPTPSPETPTTTSANTSSNSSAIVTEEDSVDGAVHSWILGCSVLALVLAAFLVASP